MYLLQQLCLSGEFVENQKVLLIENKYHMIPTKKINGMEIKMRECRLPIVILITIAFSGMMSGQAPNWAVNPADFEFNLSLIGVILFDDVESTDENDMIAAFVGDEVRGVASPTLFPVTGRYTFGMAIYSNQSSGETHTFKAYDASTDSIFDISETIEFVSDAVVGDDMNPLEFHNIFSISGPVADFSADQTEGDAPLTITFTDLSVGGDTTIVSWSWDFDGDDQEDATGQGPHQYTYADTGLYTVSLTVTDSNGLSDIETKTDYITALLVDQTLDWIVNTANFEFNLSLIGVILFDDVESTDENDIIAAFVGDEIRGVASPTLFPVTGRYTFGMAIYSNQSSGETHTFKAYDASTDSIFDISETIEFVSDAVIGDDMNPEEFHNTVNESPMAEDDVYEVDEDNTLIVDGPGVLANDSDINEDVLSVVLVVDVFYGTLSLNGDGSFTYTPDTNFFGVDSFTYAASDDEFSDTALVMITVNAVDDWPVVSSIPDTTVQEGETNITWCDLDDYLLEVDGDIVEWSYSGNVELNVSIDGENVVMITIPDENWNGSETITFKATDVGTDNVYSISDSAVFSVIIVGIADGNSQIPRVFSLSQNYPNPFNPVTTIGYGLPNDAIVILTIYDILGRPVATLASGDQHAGWYEIRWNGLTDRGEPASAGVYIFRLKAGEFTDVKKMILIK